MQYLISYHSSSELVERSLWNTFNSQHAIEAHLLELFENEKARISSSFRHKRQRLQSLFKVRNEKNKRLNELLRNSIIERVRKEILFVIKDDIERVLLTIAHTVIGDYFSTTPNALSRQAKELLDKISYTPQVVVSISPSQHQAVAQYIPTAMAEIQHSDTVTHGDVTVRFPRAKVASSWKREVDLLVATLTERITSQLH